MLSSCSRSVTGFLTTIASRWVLVVAHPGADVSYASDQSIVAMASA